MKEKSVTFTKGKKQISPKSAGGERVFLEEFRSLLSE